METSRAEKLSALVRERSEQDQRLAEAQARLAALGQVIVTVPRAALEAIAEACLVWTSTLNPGAIRA